MSVVNIVLDATMLDTFMSCECKFNYRFNLNKIPTTKSEPLDRGSIIHIGAESYFNGIKNQVNYDERIAVLKEVIHKEWLLNSELPEEKLNFIIKCFIESCEVFRDRDEQMEILAVEQSFSYVLHEDEVMRLIMIGKIDLLVNEPGYVKLPYDHKSYERSSPLDRKAMQFSNYTYACQSNYLMVNRVGLQTSLKPTEKHKRVPLSYDPLFLEQWKQNTIKWAYRYLECAQSNEWPLNTTSCNKYNRMCEYDEICNSSGVEAKIYKLEANYNTAEPWDVSSSLGKK